MGGEELDFVKDAFEKNWIAPVGPHISDFEKELSNISENYNVAAVSSGTSAIHLALLLLSVQPGDEVICSTFTFAASANPIKYIGATPVFVDSENVTWNMCPKMLEKAITDRINNHKKPKAIIIVHLYGMPANIDEIVKIANNYSIPIIEDAAEALGSKYFDQQLGTFGVFGVYSFNGNKIITTSSGGALLSKQINLIDKAKFLATQARDEAPHYQHSNIGYNYRMSNVCASIGLGQIKVLKDRVNRKRYINDYYKKKLAHIPFISFLEERKFCKSNFWLTTIVLSTESTIDKEKFRLFMEKNNIEVRPLWKPMHLQPIYKESPSYINGVSEDLFNRGLCLPSGTNMKIDDLERVIKCINQLYEI